MKTKREEAIEWVLAFQGNGKSEILTWEDIITIDRIQSYAGGNAKLELAVKWGIEEGAIAMLMKLFDMKEEEIDER